jgi:hypothetical protein
VPSVACAKTSPTEKEKEIEIDRSRLTKKQNGDKEFENREQTKD